MEENNFDNTNLADNNASYQYRIPISSQGVAVLQEGRKWVNFIAIIWFVFAALYLLNALQSIIAGLGFLLGISTVSELENEFYSIIDKSLLTSMMIFGGLYYAAMGAIMIAYSLYDYRFADYTAKAISQNNSQEFSKAITNLANSFRLKAIGMLVGIGVSLLLIIGVLIYVLNNTSKIEELMNSADKVFTLL